jgi:hypothetical protein
VKPRDPKTAARRRARHFLAWWSVVALMLLTLTVTCGFGALLLGYVVWIALDPAQSFASAWHPVVAVVFGVGVLGGGLWLLGYGLWILRGVVRALSAAAAATPPPDAEGAPR